MKPPRFSYYAPETISEAISLLQEHGDDAQVLAGGQSLVPLMNMRLARPSVLVDVCRIPELSGVTKGDSGLSIGATTRQIAVRRSSAVGEATPVVGQAMRFVGHVATQSQGTFGGSAAHADPAAEIPAVLLALEAELIAEGPNGKRRIRAEDFYSTYFTTTLGAAEVLIEIHIPAQDKSVRSTFLEVARRHGDFALVGVAAMAQIREDERIESTRIALCGIAPRPVRATAAEKFVQGTKLDPSTALEAGRIAAEALEPISDIHASSSYRKDVSAVLVRRALTELQNAGPQDLEKGVP